MSETKNVRLLPCPFCGAQPRMSTYVTESLWSHDQVTYTKVSCDECEISFHSEPGFEIEAPAAWNRRTTLEPAPKPAGGEWVTVPREPTADMLAMGDEAMVDTVDTDNWLAHCRNAWAAMLSAAPPAPAASPTHRHKKRGSEYVLIGYGKMQAEFWEERTDGTIDRPSHMESVDMREVAIYRSVDDGSLWVRPREEFEDGRFEPLPVRTSPEAPQASEGVRELMEALELAANSAGFQYMTYETRVKISAVLAAYKRSTTDGNA